MIDWEDFFGEWLLVSAFALLVLMGAAELVMLIVSTPWLAVALAGFLGITFLLTKWLVE